MTLMCVTNCGQPSRTTTKQSMCENCYQKSRICTVEGCVNPGRYRGQRCGTHNIRTKVCDTDGCSNLTRGPRTRICCRCRRRSRPCRTDGCTNIGDRRGQLCKVHADAPSVGSGPRPLPDTPCPLGCGRPWHNRPADPFPMFGFAGCAGSKAARCGV